MKQRLLDILVAFLLAFTLLGGIAVAQSSETASPEKATTEAGQPEQASGNANAGIGQILARTTESAAHTAEKWGKGIGLSPAASYTISIAVNFAGLAFFFYFLMKSKLPQAFRERTAAIQRGIKEAEAASADAARRLGDIEARLQRLDKDVEEIRKSAERDAAAEEERIRRAAEEDSKKVIDHASAEITAITRNARRELKAYAAGLAVDLAESQLRIDDATDHTLVRDFVGRLGKDGTS